MYVGHLLQHTCTLDWLITHNMGSTHVDFRCSQPVAVFEEGIAYEKEAMTRQTQGRNSILQQLRSLVEANALSD